jgi:hypothetical protein
MKSINLPFFGLGQVNKFRHVEVQLGERINTARPHEHEWYCGLPAIAVNFLHLL